MSQAVSVPVTRSGWALRGLVLLLVAIAICWALFSEGNGGIPDGEESKGAKSQQGQELPASAVLRIDPRKAAPQRIPPKTPQGISADLIQLRAKRDLAGLFNRLASGPQTAEALYIKAEIYRRCATRPGVRPTSQEAARKEFASQVAGTSFASERLTAYDRLRPNACEGLAFGQFSEKELDALVAAAATAGSQQAQAWQMARQIEQDYNDAMSAPGDHRLTGYVISDQQFSQIRTLLSSGDPGVLAELQGVLSSSWDQARLSVNGSSDPSDNRALNQAVSFALCDLGQDCGPNSAALLRACALRGQCGVSSLYDFVYFYEASPSQAQLIEQYRRAILDAMQTHDSSRFELVRGVAPSGYTFIFGRQPP